jgi:hypothetical protein
MSRERPAFFLALLLSVLSASGCGVKTAGLDVRYPEAGVNRSLLASTPPRRVEILPVADRRADTKRIGIREGNDVVTRRPVRDIVGEALVLELRKNGHTVTADRRDVVLAGAVEEFRLDAIDGYSSIQYVGRVVLGVTLADPRSGETLLIRRYVGISRRVVDKDADNGWRDVMDVALARTMHDFATDPELASVMARRLTAFNP